MTDFYLIRHGQTLANRKGIMQGTSDNELTRLTATGRRQCQHTQRLLAGQTCDLVVTSPLHRALESVQLIFGQRPLPLEKDPEFAEKDYGTATGQSLAQLQAQYPDQFDQRTGEFIAEQDLVERDYVRWRKAMLAQQLLKYHRRFPTGTVMIVSHGWTIKIITALVLGMLYPDRLMDVDNGSITKISIINQEIMYLDYYNRV